MISMKKNLFLLLSVSVLSACSVMQSLNPFAPNVKMEKSPVVHNQKEVKTVWSVQVGSGGKNVFHPAFLKERVFAANQKGQVVAFQNGNKLWENHLNTTLSAGVGFDEELIFVGSQKGQVWALNADDGKILWQAQLSSEVVQKPVSTPVGVVVKTADERLFLLNRQNGKRLWFYQHPMQTLQVRDSAHAVFAGGFIFAGFSSGKLIALSPDNGAPVWQGQVAIPKGSNELDRLSQVSTPLSIEEILCAAAYQGQVACFNMMKGGTLFWQRKIGSVNALSFDLHHLYVSDDKGVLHALNRQTATTVWQNTQLKTRNPSSITEGAGILALGDSEGFVYFLNPENGQFLAKIKTDGSAIQAPILFDNGQFIIQTTDGLILSVEVL